MHDAVSEIKSRLNIEDLVSQYVVLKRMGANLKGLCPFHSEKTPSFVVSPERGIAYCFGCHKGGDIFKFLQEVEGVEFTEALKILAERTGVELETKKYLNKITKNEKTDLFQIHEEVTGFYENKLWDSLEGSKVLEYLKQRGIQAETIKKFRVGFAPDSFDETYKMLCKKGFSKKNITLAGLALAKDTTLEQIYDRFRGRLMFPVTDNLGRIVGFGGRALKSDQEPKYLNSPETPIYQKSNILYGFSFTKQEIKNSQKVIIVEGYMDLLAAYQSDLKQVVAVSGTALTLRQLNHLKPYIKELILAFDMDKAGQEAAKRAYELTEQFDFQIKIMALPEGKDIAEFAKNHADELPTLLQKTALFSDYIFETLLSKYDKNSLKDKKKFVQEFSEFFVKLKSKIEQDEYIRRIAVELNLTETQVYDEIKSLKLAKSHPARMAAEQVMEADSSLNYAIDLHHRYQASDLVLGLFIEFPELLLKFESLIPTNFFPPALIPIYNAFSDQYNPGSADYDLKIAQKKTLNLNNLDYDLAEKARLLSLYVGEKYQDFSYELLEKELSRLISKVVNTDLIQRKRQLQRRMLEAEQNGNVELRQKLLEELGSLHFKNN